MNSLDQNLKRNRQWYRQWHQNSFSSLAHWSVLILFSFLLALNTTVFCWSSESDFSQSYQLASYQQRQLAAPSPETDSQPIQTAETQPSSKSSKDSSAVVAADDWYDSGWQYRKKITIDHTEVDDDLTDFPVLISRSSDADLAAHAQDDFDDLVFTDDSHDQLSHEIEAYDSGTGELRAWVKTDLADATNTELYLYYGNSSCGNQENVNDVWSNSYLMVQHLEEAPPNDTGTHYDSTANDYNGTPEEFDSIVGSRTDGSGKIDGADEFEDDDRVDIGQRVTNATDDFTVSLWLYPDTDSLVYYQDLAFYNGDDAGGWGFGLGDNNDSKLRALYGGVAWIDSGYSVPVADSWYQIVMLRDSGTTKFYVNGSQTPNTSGQAPFLPNDHCYIGGEFGKVRFMDGYIDEVRVSSIPRLPQWLSTQYNNQDDPEGFYDLSDETAREVDNGDDGSPTQDDLSQDSPVKLLPQAGSPSQ